MKQQQIMLFQSVKKKYYDFLDQILQNCDIDEATGKLYCKKCKNAVHIDWSRNIGYCSFHIISRFGVTYIDNSQNIYL